MKGTLFCSQADRVSQGCFLQHPSLCHNVQPAPKPNSVKGSSAGVGIAEDVGRFVDLCWPGLIQEKHFRLFRGKNGLWIWQATVCNYYSSQSSVCEMLRGSEFEVISCPGPGVPLFGAVGGVWSISFGSQLSWDRKGFPVKAEEMQRYCMSRGPPTLCRTTFNGF